MKKFLCLFILIVITLTLLSGCNPYAPYDEDWIIGKTSIEIKERYGDFYQAENSPNEKGLYYSTSCHYFLKERPLMLGDTEITLFSIGFDKNGVAYRCYTSLGPIGG